MVQDYEEDYKEDDNLYQEEISDDETLEEEGITEPTYSSSEQGDKAIMQSFFSLNDKLKKFELKYKGLSYINGSLERTHDAIAKDSFIDSIITLLESVISPDNSISTTGPESANVILWEKFDAFSIACTRERTFQYERYTMLKEDIDHILELFMGHVINSHGIKSATSLQAGVTLETEANRIKANKGVFEQVSNYFKN